MSNSPDNNEPFLSRWSRRKQAVAKGEPVPAVEGAEAAPLGEAEGAGGGAKQPAGEMAEGEEELDLSTLPKVEELNEYSDIKAFLDQRVPAALRNAALKRMWTLDPTIRDFIEVAENQWNWNVPGGAPFYEPLEGGVEMAEEILSGFASGAKALAEAVLPGDSSSTLVDGEGGARMAVDVAAPIKDEPVADAAVQGEPATTAVRNDAVMPESIRHSGENFGDIATQQIATAAVPEDAPRRRHGGALPG